MKKEKKRRGIRLLRKNRVITGLLLLMWIPWGVMSWPGTVLWDTGTGIAWFLNLNRSNVNNPWFQNLLAGVFYEIGNWFGFPTAGITLYCVLQAALEAWLLGKMITFLAERTGAGKGAYLLIPFFGLLPVFPIYVFTMAKDSNLAVAMLGTIYLLTRAAVEGEAFWAQKRNRVWMTILPAVLGLLRNYAGIIPLAIIIVLLLKARRKAGILPAALAALGLAAVTFFIPRLAGIPPSEVREEMSIPLQTTAVYVTEHTDEVTEEELLTIGKVVDPETFQEAYNRMIADPIKDKSHFTVETRNEFLRMWFGMFLKHPDTILSAWWASTDLYFAWEEGYPAKSPVTVGININRELKEKLGLTTSWTEGNAAMHGAYYDSLQIPVVRTLEQIGPYSWALLVMTLAALIFRRLRRWLPCCLLLMMVLTACVLSPVNGYYRYAYPMILSVPVVLTAMAGSLRERKRTKT